jgi:hypothetical protein
MTEPGRGGGELERSADPTGAHSPAVDDEQQLDGPLGARVDQSPAPAPTADPVVEGVEGGLVERHGPLVVELAERHSEPGAVVGVVDDTVEFEIEQFAEAQIGAAQDVDGAASGGVVELVDGGHEVSVAVGAQRSGDGFGEAWQVAAMDKRPGRSLRPSPQGEVLEERLERRHGLVLAGD